jgi:hypothetical protein
MDGGRFDALARALAGSGSRRAALGGLLGGALALLGAGGEETAGHDPSRRCRNIRDARKRRACLARAKRHTRQHEGGGGGGACPAEPLERCLAPAVEAFVAAIEPCRAACTADPEGAACRSCLGPPTEAAVAAARACAEEVCGGGGGAAAGAAGGGGVAAAAPGRCDRAGLDRCLDRANRDAAIIAGGAALGCLTSVGAACAVAVALALAGVAALYSDCQADYGCPGEPGGPDGRCCNNRCFPFGSPVTTPCGDTCCAPGQTCCDGSCRDGECDECPGGGLRCGRTCCPAASGWSCRDGECYLDCGPTGCGG